MNVFAPLLAFALALPALAILRMRVWCAYVLLFASWPVPTLLGTAGFALLSHLLKRRPARRFAAKARTFRRTTAYRLWRARVVWNRRLRRHARRTHRRHERPRVRTYRASPLGNTLLMSMFALVWHGPFPCSALFACASRESVLSLFGKMII